MKRIGPIAAAFTAGFLLAAAVCLLIILPILNQMTRNEIENDVYSPLGTMVYYASLSAANQEPGKAVKQLTMLNERFNAYRNDHGPSPKLWWREVVNYKDEDDATTKSAR